MCAAIEAMRLESKQEGRAEGRAEGINEANERMATDMLKKKKYTFPEIVELSKLSEEVVLSLAQKLGISIA